MVRFWKLLNNLYEWLLILVFGLLLLIGIWAVLDNYYVFAQADRSDLLRWKPGSVTAGDAASSPITEDMVGWLTLDGTGIDEPVMQGERNDKYLSTDPFGRYSLSGSIFLDSRNAADFSDAYSLIYGHHMERGRMFGALDAYREPDYLQSHRSGTLLIGRNGETKKRLEVFACLNVSSREKAVFEPDAAANRQYLAAHLPAETALREAPILALTTCADGGQTARTAVFCYILPDE